MLICSASAAGLDLESLVHRKGYPVSYKGIHSAAAELTV